VAGVGTTSLTIDASDLDRSKSYEAVAWQHMSFPSSETIYAVTKLEVTSEQWDVVFPIEYTPELSVSPSAELDPAGASVTVTGSGYNPAQAIYVFLCSDTELPTDLFAHAMGCRDGAVVVYEHGAVKRDGTPQPLQFDADGHFSTAFSVKALDASATAVFTSANHTAMADRGQDAKAVLSFAPAKDTSVAVNAPSESVFGDAVQLSATVTPVNAEGTVTFYADQVQVGDPQTLLLGSASLSTSELRSGTHEITARFTPKNSKVFKVSGSEARSLNVEKALTSIKLSDPATTVFGAEAKLQASITPDAEGTVEFFVEEHSVGTAKAVNGSASIAVAELNADTYDVTAKFTPAADSNYEESESDGVILIVEKAKTVTALVAPLTLELGTSASLKAEVSPSASGSVEFFVDDNQIGTTVPVIDGAATSEKTPALNKDTHVVRAVFTSNDSNYLGSEGTVEIRTVDHDSATATILNGEQKIEPGANVRFEVGEFAVGTDVNGVIDPVRAPEEPGEGSEPEGDDADTISLQAAMSGTYLGTKTVGANGFAAFEFVVPDGFEGEHTAIFTTATGTETAVNFVVEVAAVGTAGSGADGSGTGADAPVADASGVNANGSSASSQNPQGVSSAGAANTAGDQLASTGGEDLAGVTIAALLALIAGACVVTMRRRVNR
ncbi:Ig-like domain-containing protein, partial [Leucobacter sp. NPDC077196]|uniref:Ig-like domain-containing protein n=1 Tax=Leucobacter sp. NPDC077196 TaxID=3154959 RepID=UPI00341B59B2